MKTEACQRPVFQWSRSGTFLCPNVLGVGAIDVQTHRVETPEEIAQTIQRVATFIDPERLWVNPDCGLNHLPRDVAFAKLGAMVAGTQLVKQQLVRS